MGNKGKVLVVDDDNGILEVVRIILNDSGYEIMTTNKSENIMELIYKFEPKVILLDIKMPGTPGDDVCRQIKANIRTSNIPVILLSASLGTKKKSVESGADGYLYKPFDMMELLEVVEKYVEKNFEDGTNSGVNNQPVSC